MSRTSVETYTGQILDYACPTKEMVSIDSIAVGLSRQPRFCGQTIGRLQYSVAQHSVHVAAIVQLVMQNGSPLNEYMKTTTSAGAMLEYLNDDLRLEKDRRLGTLLGLFHDGSEAFLCDIPTPAKRLPGLMEAYLRIEAALMHAIHDYLGIDDESISPELKAIVHWADQYALAVEAYFLVPSRGRGEEWAWLMQPLMSDLAEWAGPYETTFEAYEVFMETYEIVLTGEV